MVYNTIYFFLCFFFVFGFVDQAMTVFYNIILISGMSS